MVTWRAEMGGVDGMAWLVCLDSRSNFVSTLSKAMFVRKKKLLLCLQTGS